MTIQEAIAILMLSPFYFKLPPVDRKKLVQEYCDLFNKGIAPSTTVSIQSKE